MSTGGAAFFDLDRTLITINSAKEWFRQEREQGRISRRQTLEAAGWLGLYGLGLMEGRLALGRAARTVAGDSEAALIERTEAFFGEIVKPAYAPGGLDAVREHQEAGEPVVLLTSASNYLAQLVVRDLGLDGALAMELEVEDGLFTGGIQRFCFGAGKVEQAELWLAERQLDIGDCAFYTDSITDAPMLSQVGRPYVVQPDARLARAARRQGWPVLDWAG
jgi:HAD superfamily hydrolase (TIGR01490 family)